MSEEMNLYKRCKNIFKAHGVDMGGGGSGGSRFVVTVSMDFQTGDMTADKSFNDILTALESNQNVMAKLVVILGQESQLIGMYPFVAYEMPGLIAFGYYYQGDIDGFALSVEQEESGEDLWDSAIVPHPDD